MAKRLKKKGVDFETIGQDLNEKQELFCRLYATEREFFGNGVDSYAEAYDVDTTKPKWRDWVYVNASRLLSSAKILKRIDQLLEITGFNDSFVDKELSFLITQKADFGNKLGAIREYNKLKKRINDNPNIVVKLPTPIYGGKSKIPVAKTKSIYGGKSRKK